MFKTLPNFTIRPRVLVSADAKTCGSPLYSVPAGGSLRQAQDRLRLPAGKDVGILTHFQTKVNKKDE